MSTDQEQLLSEALHTAQPPPSLHVDLAAVLITAHRTRRRRQLGGALVTSAGIAAVATAGLWVVDVLPGSTSDLSPAGVSLSPADETYEIEGGPNVGTGNEDAALKRAGQAAQERQYDCLESRGVPVERFPDGSAQIGPVEGDTPGGPDQTLREMRLCSAKAGFLELERLGPEQVSQLYDENLQAAQCLREHGYDPAQAVSQENFIKAYNAALAEPSTVPWTPYQTINDPAALDRCPEPSLQD